MKVLYERVAGIDLHKDRVKVAIRSPGDKPWTRKTGILEFRTFYGVLQEMAHEMRRRGVTHVVMEASGVYTEPVYNAPVLPAGTEGKAPPPGRTGRSLHRHNQARLLSSHRRPGGQSRPAAAPGRRFPMKARTRAQPDTSRATPGACGRARPASSNGPRTTRRHARHIHTVRPAWSPPSRSDTPCHTDPVCDGHQPDSLTPAIKDR